MPKVILYKPCHSATQSGSAPQDWCIKFPDPNARFKDPIMGWTGSTDMNQEIIMNFPDLDSAKAYLEKNNFDYQVIMPEQRIVKQKSYANNFK